MAFVSVGELQGEGKTVGNFIYKNIIYCNTVYNIEVHTIYTFFFHETL